MHNSPEHSGGGVGATFQAVPPADVHVVVPQNRSVATPMENLAISFQKCKFSRVQNSFVSFHIAYVKHRNVSENETLGTENRFLVCITLPSIPVEGLERNVMVISLAHAQCHVLCLGLVRDPTNENVRNFASKMIFFSHSKLVCFFSYRVCKTPKRV